MSIYVISALNGSKYAGPSYSVPRTIAEMSNREQIIWINMLPSYLCSLDLNVNLTYIPFEKYKMDGIEQIFEKYGKPEIVIFEELFNVDYCYFAKKIRKQGIPYVITPRGCLCGDAQSKKAVKKKLANLLLFNKFVHNAACIRYLTEKEAEESGDKWNRNFCVIPNGTDIPKQSVKRKYEEPIKGAFIGRLDIFHKGLDLLVEAYSIWKRDSNISVVIDIYGADSVGDKDKLKVLIHQYKLENHVRIFDPVYDEEKYKVLKSYDFFILTSRFEGHPMGLLEALSYGLPSLVTEGSNMASEIKKGKCGWASETTVAGVVSSFRNLEKDFNRLNELSYNAVALAKEYSWDNVSNMIFEQISRIRR